MPFQMLFADWFQSIIGPVTVVMAIDGRTSSSGDGDGAKHIHTVSVYSNDTGMTLAHVDVGEKANEMPTIPEVFNNRDITGAYVTIDVMGCQTVIASASRSKRAHYLLAVQEN